MEKLIPGARYMLDNRTEVTIVKPHNRLADRYVVESVMRKAVDKTILLSCVELVHAARLKPLPVQES